MPSIGGGGYLFRGENEDNDFMRRVGTVKKSYRLSSFHNYVLYNDCDGFGTLQFQASRQQRSERSELRRAYLYNDEVHYIQHASKMANPVNKFWSMSIKDGKDLVSTLADVERRRDLILEAESPRVDFDHPCGRFEAVFAAQTDDEAKSGRLSLHNCFDLFVKVAIQFSRDVSLS